MTTGAALPATAEEGEGRGELARAVDRVVTAGYAREPQARRRAEDLTRAVETVHRSGLVTLVRALTARRRRPGPARRTGRRPAADALPAVLAPPGRERPAGARMIRGAVSPLPPTARDAARRTGQNRWQTVEADTFCWPCGLPPRGGALAVTDSGATRVMTRRRR